MKPFTVQVQAFLWVNLACVCWAGNLVAGRLMRDAIGPGLLVALRTLLAACLLAMLAYLLRPEVRRGERREPRRSPGPATRNRRHRPGA